MALTACSLVLQWADQVAVVRDCVSSVETDFYCSVYETIHWTLENYCEISLRETVTYGGCSIVPGTRSRQRRVLVLRANLANGNRRRELVLVSMKHHYYRRCASCISDLQKASKPKSDTHRVIYMFEEVHLDV